MKRLDGKIAFVIGAGGGSVIDMASMNALMGTSNRACDCAAKGGVDALTRSMAVSDARQAIRVNAIAPGITQVMAVDGGVTIC